MPHDNVRWCRLPTCARSSAPLTHEQRKVPCLELRRVLPSAKRFKSGYTPAPASWPLLPVTQLGIKALSAYTRVPSLGVGGAPCVSATMS